jgi:hypothetical protein
LGLANTTRPSCSSSRPKALSAAGSISLPAVVVGAVFSRVL